MRKTITLMLLASMSLSACSGWRDSGANPANWFGKSRATPVQHSTATGAANPLLPEKEETGLFRRLTKQNAEYTGTLMDQVTALHIERTHDGAIVRATGQAARLGAHDLRLVPENNGIPIGGVLTYSFKAVQPDDAAQGSARLRRHDAGHFIAEEDLALIREIRVVAGRNAITRRR